jgi:hypothetical protein
MTPAISARPSLAPLRQHFAQLLAVPASGATPARRVAFFIGSERFGMQKDVYRCHACLSDLTDLTFGCSTVQRCN